MAKQVNLKINIDGENGAINVAKIKSLTISQRVSDHHRFELLVSYDTLEKKSGGFLTDFAQKLCGKPVSISFGVSSNGSLPEVQFKGIINTVILVNYNANYSDYRIQGFSPTYLLESSIQRRTFTKKTLEEIMNEVCKGISDNTLKRRIKTSFNEPIPYTVQYDESNFRFLHRLAFHYGQWFYYDGRQLIFGSPPDTSEPIEYQINAVQSFSLSSALRQVNFKMFQYDYLNDKSFQGSSSSQQPLKSDHLSHNAISESENLYTEESLYHVGKSIHTQSELDDTIKRFKSSLVSDIIIFWGHGETMGLSLGSVIKVKGPIKDGKSENYSSYRIVSIDHEVNASNAYVNSFKAIPEYATSDQEGVNTPKGIPELAKVIDLKDPEKLGRVKVQFYWPNNNTVASQSNWMRVMTPYSGEGKGLLFSPEVGAQVLVGYESESVEQPMVLGTIFPKKNGLTYTYDNNQLKSIHTKGGNKIIFDDKSGEEKIKISNSKNKDTVLTLTFKGDGNIDMKSNGPINIASKKDITIEGKNINLKSDQDIKAQGSNISFKADQNLKGQGSQMSLKGDSSAELSSDSGELKLSGMTSSLKGSTEVEIQGAIVKIN